jgi:hypothetical protein
VQRICSNDVRRGRSSPIEKQSCAKGRNCQATECATGFTESLLPLHAVAALGKLLGVGSAELDLTLLRVPEPDELLESSTELQGDHVARID